MGREMVVLDAPLRWTVVGRETVLDVLRGVVLGTGREADREIDLEPASG